MTHNELLAHVLAPADMDTSVRPQDDFYRYCNGAWIDRHVIPADRPTDGAFYQLRDLSEEQCRAIVEDAVKGVVDDADAERIAIIYSQFMDEAHIEELGSAPLQPFIEVITNASSHEELAEAVGKLGKLGISPFFAFDVSTDMNDANRYQLYIGQAGLGLPDESYYRDAQYAPIVERYQQYIATMFSLAHVLSAEDSAADVFGFEKTLASLHWDIVAMRDVAAQNNPRSWEEITQQNPGFDWQRWADALGLDTDKTGALSVGQVDYLAAASELWAKTELTVLQNWLLRKTIGFAAPYLSSAFVNENFEMYSKTLAGTEEIRPRWKRALSLVEGLLGEALGRLYVGRHFPPEYKDQVEELVSNLIEAYRDSITTLDWMGDATRAQALEKLDGFTPRIAYPSKWRDYSELAIRAQQTLLENIAEAQSFETAFELGKLGSPVDPEEWHMTPQTVNAYYNPLSNEIVFPAAILRAPFFDPDADDAVNYAGIGAVIGHEIGHGFDDQGSQFDANGEMRNWWTDEDREEFTQRTKALIAQYDAFSPAALPDSHKVNGALTIGENIGDLGGLTIAWKAWEKALKKQGIASPADAPEIDGLSGPERFFMSWARIWQSKARNEYAIQLLAVDPHSPTEFRCNGVLANFDEFAKYMNVRKGDGLWIEPSQRVHIW